MRLITVWKAMTLKQKIANTWIGLCCFLAFAFIGFTVLVSLVESPFATLLITGIVAAVGMTFWSLVNR